MASYLLNRGINKSWELNGLVGQFVYFLAGGIVLTFVLFVVLYLIGIPVLVTIGVTLGVGVGMWAGVGHLNVKYGEHGMMKASAKRSAPQRITNRSSRLFLNLNEDQAKR